MDIRIGHLLVIQIILHLALYRVTHQSIRTIYIFFRRVRFSDTLSKIFVSIIFLPGTFVHELSHFISALVTMHRVTGFTIWPVIGTKGVRMGSVSYYHKHPILSLVVGIAPLFGGYIATTLIFLWIQNSTSLLVHTLLWYMLITIQSTMFTSESDLKEAVWIIPIVCIAGLIIYISGADVLGLFAYSDAYVMTFFFTVVQAQLACLGAHVALIAASRVGGD